MAWRSLAILCASSLLALTISDSTTVFGADYPPFEKVIEGFKKIETPGDRAPMYTLYVKENEGELLIELPKNYTMKNYFIGLTVASGQVFAGLQAGDFYVQWDDYNKRLTAMISRICAFALVETKNCKDSVDRLFTGQVLLDLPILCLSPRGGPVIDGDQLLVANASVFFGSDGRSSNPRLAKIVKSKAFPLNIELAFEMPSRLVVCRHSIIRSARSHRTPAIRHAWPINASATSASLSDYGKYKAGRHSLH